MLTPRLGLILLFVGDKRKVQAVIDNATSFSAESHVLKNGDTDVTAAYIADSPDSVGNILMSATIGGNAPLPAGTYRYFINGTYGGKATTWYWDVLVLAKDLSQIEEIPAGDYDPFLGDVVMYEGDNRNLALHVPGLDFSAATNALKLGDDTTPTTTYCNGTVTPLGEEITTQNLGGLAQVPAGEYGLFVSGTHSNAEAITTWYWRVHVLPKQSAI
jgi:hypothetical protein